MVIPANLEIAVDIGLMVAAGLLLLRFLMTQPKAKQSQQLVALEGTIRGLIEQATSASASLDGSLQRRKRELEALVNKLEKLEKKGEAKAAKISTPPPAPDDLPNETWYRRESTPRQQSIDELAFATDDTVSLSSVSKPQALKDQVEVLRDERLTSLGSADDSTYNIARRLLLQGKPIHQVARNLELPIAEVRLLESMIAKERPRDTQVLQYSSGLR